MPLNYSLLIDHLHRVAVLSHGVTMNFIAKQVLKSKTGALTDKLDEVSKKCKDLLESDEPDTAPQAQNLSEEEQMKQEVSRNSNSISADVVD